MRLFQFILAGLAAPFFLMTSLPGQMSPEAMQIVERYIDAMGGRSNLHNIKSVRLTCRIHYPDGTSNGLVVLKKVAY